jgi:hypothetical protein
MKLCHIGMNEYRTITPRSYNTKAVKHEVSSKSGCLAERHSWSVLQSRYLDMESGVGHCPLILEELSVCAFILLVLSCV